MKFNNLKKIPPHVRQIIYIIIIVIAAPLLTWLMLEILIPFLSTKFSELSTPEIIASLAIIWMIFSVSTNLIFTILKRQLSTQRQIKVDVDVKNNNAIITCTIDNFGRKRIKPKNIYLFVDQGILKEDSYKFPYLLKHEEGEYDCVLSKICKAGGVESFPDSLRTDEFKNQYHKVFKLKHLSTESILYIDPGESFSEDAILEFNERGAYRAMVVWTAVNEDCICASKQFIISK